MTNFTYHVRSERIKNISSSNAKDASNGAVESVHVIQSESFLLFRLKVGSIIVHKMRQIINESRTSYRVNHASRACKNVFSNHVLTRYAHNLGLIKRHA